VGALPLNGEGYREIRGEVLSPLSNPFGANLNGEGVYVIDCLGQQVVIAESRIVATIVLVNPASGSGVQNAVNWEPAVANYPALLVDGSMRFEFDNTPLSEAAVKTNFNPAGTPYLGSEDSDKKDEYPSLIKGLVYVSGDLTVHQTPTLQGRAGRREHVARLRAGRQRGADPDLRADVSRQPSAGLRQASHGRIPGELPPGRRLTVARGLRPSPSAGADSRDLLKGPAFASLPHARHLANGTRPVPKKNEGSSNNWNDPANWSGDQLPGPGDHVVIDVPHTVMLDIDIGAAEALGSFTLDDPGAKIFTDGHLLTVNGPSINKGTVDWEDGTWAGTGTLSNLGTLRLERATIDTHVVNSGTLEAHSSSNSITGTPTNQTGGQVQLQGALAVTGGTLTNQGGGVIRTLVGEVEDGVRYLIAELDNQGTLNVQEYTLMTAAAANHLNSGTIDVDGDTLVLGYFDTTGLLDLEIGGEIAGVDHDLLDISGIASFDGTLGVEILPGFTPTAGDTFQVSITVRTRGSSQPSSARADAAGALCRSTARPSSSSNTPRRATTSRT